MELRNRLYSQWVEHHAQNYVRFINLFVIGSMIICGVFDYFFFGTLDRYTWARLIPTALSLVAYRYYLTWNRQGVSPRALTSVVMVVSSLVLNVQYHYYLTIAPSNEMWIVFIGNILVAFFTLISVFKFGLAQAIISFPSLISSIWFAWNFSNLQSQFLLIAITYVVCMFLTYLWRRDFKSDLELKFQSLRMMLPRKEAEALTVLDRADAWDRIFQPRMRFSVCLCADWRGYQEISRNTDPKELAYFFELFYEPALELLNKVDPDGRYYASWVADELFVIFYDEDDNKHIAMDKALRFSRAFSGEFFDVLRKMVPFKLRYDIGIACGEGLLGMQGPKGLKRTTITAEHAGIAKRFQTEAKLYRADRAGDRPGTVMDERLRARAIEIGLYSDEQLRELMSDHPDLKGLKLYFGTSEADSSDPDHTKQSVNE